MPAASNPLLQLGPLGNAARASASAADKSPQAGASKANGFDQVLAGQARENGAARAATARAKDRGEAAAPGKPGPSGIAADGKTAPGAAKGDGVKAADPASADARLVAGQVTDGQPGGQMLQAQAESVAPLLQAALQQPGQAVEGEAFDPEADPLADMPALRLALQQSAQAQGLGSAQATDDQGGESQPGTPGAVNPLANLAEALLEEQPGQSEPGDQAFGALLEEGLKDVQGSASDSRVDDFANRLASLTQAVTPKAAEATAAGNPLQQPLAMNQDAWSEGLVNRVMYLSSQNLKSADIQLEPAELGRLDIRVNMAVDQSTQVTFISGHAGVRDTLDSQVHRLRELFAQQGLAQPDVNVADQSRGQQQQQAGQDPSRLSGVAARRAEAGEAVEQGADQTRTLAERQVVIGSSAVDYYA